MRAIESKCLHPAPNRAGAARKGIGGKSPRTENRSSEVSVADGTREPTPEGSLHYRLLLSDGDINNRGEDVEEFNTLVCRPCCGSSEGATSVRIELALKLTFSIL